MASVRQMEATATAEKPLGLAEAEKLNFLQPTTPKAALSTFAQYLEL